MLVVVALAEGVIPPSAGRHDELDRVDQEAKVARHLAAVTRDHNLVVAGGFGSQLDGQALERALAGRIPEDRLATMPTRVVIDAHDPDGPGAIVDRRTFRILVDAGVTVLCPGDACSPVAREPTGALRGVHALMDADMVACRLAAALDADALLLLSGGDSAVAPADGPGPRLEAVRAFVAAGGWLGGVGPLCEAAGMLRAGPGVVAPCPAGEANGRLVRRLP
jgi:carbamate kinase